MTNWISTLLKDNIAQQRSLRYFLFGLPILKLGLFAEDRIMNEKIAKYKAVCTQAIEEKFASNDIKETMLQTIK